MPIRDPWCCLLAAWEGDVISHAARCPYRQEPQPDALVPLSEFTAPDSTEVADA